MHMDLMLLQGQLPSSGKKANDINVAETVPVPVPD